MEYIFLAIAIYCASLFSGLDIIPWRLKNKILGWNYVLYKDSCASFVSRVVKLPSGKLYMRCIYPRDHYSDTIENDMTLTRCKTKITPLTW